MVIHGSNIFNTKISKYLQKLSNPPSLHTPRTLDASDCPITVCSHHLPRRIERCVSVEAAGVWGSAYCASAHLANAKSRELVEVTTAS